MKNHLKLAALYMLLLTAVGSATAQDEPKEKAPAEIKAIRVVPANFSGGAQWTKVLVDFRSTPKWIDGMQISVTALCGDGSPEKPYIILSGIARYINVPRGDNTGVLFVSPKTTARYGGVTAAKADIYLNDRIVSSAEYKEEGKPPAKWEATSDRRDGALLPITSTPWLAVEYDKYPDTLGGR